MSYVDTTTHGHGREWSVGDVGFSYYTMKSGTVAREPDDQGWFLVKNDDGSTDLLNDERFVTIEVAKRFGYQVDR